MRNMRYKNTDIKISFVDKWQQFVAFFIHNGKEHRVIDRYPSRLKAMVKEVIDGTD